MKNQKEIYEALLSGETLVHRRGHTAELDNGGSVIG